MDFRKLLKKGTGAALAVAMIAGLPIQALKAADDNTAQAVSDEGRIIFMDFNSGDNGLSGTGADVKVNGVTEYVTDAHEGKALSLKPNTYLSITGKNGNLLKDRDQLTISYWSKTPVTKGCNWAAYLAPDHNQVTGDAPTYFAISDQKAMKLERYKNGRDSDIAGTAVPDTWKMVTAVIDENETILYINNRKAAANTSHYKLSEILGDNGIYYVGKANWAAGEYFTGILDDYAVYDYAMTGEQVKEKYMQEAGLDPEEEIEQAVSALHIPQGREKATGNLMLPKESKNGVQFEWTSSDENVISTKSKPCAFYYNEVDIPAGIVNRQKKDTVVKLKLKASYKQTEKEYSFDVTVKAANEQKEEYAGYLYAHFNEHPGAPYDGIQQIFFGISKNGVDWTALNNNQYILESSVGDYGVRDPYIIRSAEGDKFFLIGTDLDIDSYKYGGNWGLMGSQGSQNLVVWESEDLINWSEPRLVAAASDIDAGMAWAPEAIYDEATGEYLVYWSTNLKTGGAGNHIYVAKTRDFWTFTSAELYSNAGNGEDSDPVNKNGNIDASIFKQGDTYYRLLNDGFNTSIRFQSSKKLLAYGKDLKDEASVSLKSAAMPNRGANFKLIHNSGTIEVEDTDGNKVTKPCLTQYAGAYEGPTMFKFNDREEWCILVDEYVRGAAAGPGRARGYIPFVSTDLDQPNSIYLPSEDEFVMPDAAKHGTVIPITQSEYDRLAEKWGTPKQEGNEKAVDKPVLTYDFESAENAEIPDISSAGADNTGKLKGGAKVVELPDKGKVLELSGSGYLSFPDGFFDGLSNMTLTMDVCMAEGNKNATVFSMGSTVKNKISSYHVTSAGVEKKDRYWDSTDKVANRYFNLDLKDHVVEGTISAFNAYGEMKITSDNSLDMAGKWRKVTVVAKDHVISIYVDGKLAAQEKHVRSIGELGTNLTAVLGCPYKSSAFFNGYIDNVNVYNISKDPAGEPELPLLEDLAVEAPAKTEYVIGDPFDPQGMTVTAVYSDGSSKDVTKEAKVEGFDSDSEGEKNITVSYGGMTASFVIIVRNIRLVEDVFDDISSLDWFVPYVQFVYDHKIMTGLSETVFGANDNLGRGQFAAMLYRMEKEPDVEYKETFPDVPEDMFYTDAVLWANSENIIKGYAEGTFGPADSITREQLAVMMYRYADYKGYDTSAGAELDFPDRAQVSGFAETAMKWAVGAGIISGNLDKTLAPQGNVSRAVCATMIQRFVEKVK